MKKNQIFAIASLLVFTLFCSGQLSAQWTDGGWRVWTTNLNANVGIGTDNPFNASLQFANTLGNKITLWGDGTNNYGFGINGGNLAAYMPDIAGTRFSVRLNGYGGTEKFMVTNEGNIGLNGAIPYYSRMQFDNALGNKVSFFDLGGNVGYGMGVTEKNLSVFIPNQAGNRFSLRTDNSAGGEKFMVTNEGKVSIGSRLYVGATGTESGGYGVVQFKTTTATGGVIRSSSGTTDAGNAPLILDASSLNFSNNNTIKMTMNSAGYMGLGTSNLTYRLNVNGTIRAKEVRVESNWADYVFEPDYSLRPLAEVEKYIQANKHLPDVTSAEDIQKDGVQVGEQMTQMMRKIEELTLYVIDLKKENTKTQAENADLKKRLEKLEK